MQLRVRKRGRPLHWLGYLLVVAAALVVSCLLGALMLALQGKPGLEGMALFLRGGFGDAWALQDAALKAIPIFLCSLGVAVAFRLQIWNIGAEGQFALGAVGATFVALNAALLPPMLVLPAMLAAAGIAGGAWGFIPALLKVRLGVNEIITTLMLNYIGILVLEYLIYGPWKDPQSFGFPMSAMFSPQAVVGSIGQSRIHWGLVLCLVIGVVLTVFLRFSRLGYELKVAGESRRVAGYARMPYAGLVLGVMCVSGALAGWAGFLETSAVVNRLQPGVMSGYGYTAIVVAWLARLNPVAIALGSFILAGVRVGVEGLQLDLQVPAAFGFILEGSVLLLVLCGQFFRSYRIERLPRPSVDLQAGSEGGSP